MDTVAFRTRERRRLDGDRIVRAILTYHSLDDSGSVISVSPRIFRQQMEWLASSATRVLPLADIMAPPTGKSALPDVAVAITFDDAFENFRTHAAPILRDLALPATCFVVSGQCGRDNRWRGTADSDIPTLPLLDWAGLASVMKSGISIGAHSRSHPHLSSCSPSELEDEIAGSREDITKALGTVPAHFAYPYGDLSSDACAIAARVFDIACTTELRVLRPTDARARAPRLDMFYWRERPEFSSWGTPMFYLSVRARQALRAVRSAGRRASRRNLRKQS